MPIPPRDDPNTSILMKILDDSSHPYCLCDQTGKLSYQNKKYSCSFGDGFIESLLQNQKNILDFFTSNQIEFNGTIEFKNKHFKLNAKKHQSELIALEFCDITDVIEKHDKKFQKLETILENIPAYIYCKDQDGKYTYGNKMFAMLHALKADTLIGLTNHDLYTKETAEVFDKNDLKVFEKGITVRALEQGGRDEYGIERGYLSVKCPITDANGEITSLLGMSLDISEQQRLEKALWESQEKLNSILDNLKARVYIKDKDYKYTYANQELCQELRLDRASMVGKTDYDLFETETAVGFRATDEEVFQTSQKVSRLETHYGADQKNKRYFWSIKVPLYDVNGVANAVLGISTDVTEQKRLEEKLIQNESRLTTILDNLKAHVYIKDTNYQYTYVNTNMCDYLGMNKEDILGKTDSEVFGTKAASQFRASDNQVFDYNETVTSIEKSRNTNTNDKFYFLSVKAPLINDNGNPYALLGISTDVSEQKRLEKELRKMASTDVLTGVNNRRFFMELCEIEIERAKRYGHDLSLIMLDVDHFKRINDTYGHAVGDEAIRSMTGICHQCLRNTDMIGRIGGEEFALLLPETNKDGAIHIAERIRAATQAHAFDIGEDKPVKFTASFGLTSMLEDDQTPDDLLKRADIALYDAKTRGRNRVSDL